MQNARIFLVEDNKTMSHLICRCLALHGHQVVLKASNLKEALQVVETGQLEKNEVDLAIIDGNFPNKADDSVDIFAGPIVAQAIKDANLPIPIIAHTSVQRNQVSYGNTYVEKGDVNRLFIAISELLFD